MSERTTKENNNIENKPGKFEPKHLPTGVKQFIKFGIVGFSSTFIDWGLYFILYYGLIIPNKVAYPIAAALPFTIDPHHIEIIMSKIVSTGFGVLNSFIWNSRWTFKGLKGKSWRRQLLKFVLVNLIGMILNTTIVTIILKPFGSPAPKNFALLANVSATAVVLFWNFFMNKYWTFRPVKNEPVH